MCLTTAVMLTVFRDITIPVHSISTPILKLAPSSVCVAIAIIYTLINLLYRDGNPRPLLPLFVKATVGSDFFFNQPLQSFIPLVATAFSPVKIFSRGS